MQQIESRAPNYLTEEYWGMTPYPSEDGLKDGKCRVRLQIAPYHTDQPGLRIHYRYKDLVSLIRCNNIACKRLNLKAVKFIFYYELYCHLAVNVLHILKKLIFKRLKGISSIMYMICTDLY